MLECAKYYCMCGYFIRRACGSVFLDSCFWICVSVFINVSGSVFINSCFWIHISGNLFMYRYLGVCVSIFGWHSPLSDDADLAARLEFGAL